MFPQILHLSEIKNGAIQRENWSRDRGVQNLAVTLQLGETELLTAPANFRKNSQEIVNFFMWQIKTGKLMDKTRLTELR